MVITVKIYLQRDISTLNARYQVADEQGRLRYTVTGKRNPSGESIRICDTDGNTVCKIRSLGFSYASTMKHIILPQAFKNILPALGNEFVTVIKESSIVSVIGIADLMYRTNGVKAKNYKTLECLFIAAIIYFVLTFVSSRLIALMERRMRRGRK